MSLQPTFDTNRTFPSFAPNQLIRTTGTNHWIVGQLVHIGPRAEDLYIPGRLYDLPNIWITMHILGDRYANGDVLVNSGIPHEKADYQGNYVGNVTEFLPFNSDEWPKACVRKVPCIPFYSDRKYENPQTVQREWKRCGPTTML